MAKTADGDYVTELTELEMRALSRVVRDEESGCWVWQGATTHNGYGHMRVGDSHVRLHRFTWEAFVGEIPDGWHVDHLCKNRLCCNPAHLEPVDEAENLRRTKEHYAPESKVNPEALSSEKFLQASAFTEIGADKFDSIDWHW